MNEDLIDISVLNFDRIEHLLNPKELSNKKVTIVGLGSGGAPVCDHLTMNGICNWHLYDPDILEPVNLVKHPRMRKDIGFPKVKIQKDWIIDRNPKAEVEAFKEDIIMSENFVKSIKKSDLVISCPDKNNVREFINEQCVRAKIPLVTASVFRTGIGGEVFGYIPGKTGCYRCLEMFSMLNEMDLPDDFFDLTDDEEEKIYGLNDKDFRASGLSIDIQMIALIQARMALSILLRDSNVSMPLLKSNWIIFGNRPKEGIFKGHFEVKQFLLKPQKTCDCSSRLHDRGI